MIRVIFEYQNMHDYPVRRTIPTEHVRSVYFAPFEYDHPMRAICMYVETCEFGITSNHVVPLDGFKLHDFKADAELVERVGKKLMGDVVSAVGASEADIVWRFVDGEWNRTTVTPMKWTTQ